MRNRLVILLVAQLVTYNGMSLPSSGFKYQAVVRNNQGVVIGDNQVMLKVSILQGAENGTAIYSEEHQTTTNAYGLINIIIGEGTNTIGNFTNIDWAADSYFLKLEMAVGTSTTMELLGVSPLLSVPYAMHAETVTNNNDADADPTNEIQILDLTGTTLSLSQSNSVDLTSLITTNTDEQTLSIVGDSLSISNGNKVDLVPYKDNTDAQTLELASSQLSISGGNSVDLSGLHDADADSTNELQQLSIVNDSLVLSKGNKVLLPKQDMVWDTAGTAIFYTKGNVGIGTGKPTGKLEVKGVASSNPDEIIFGVLNNSGDTVFAVYQGGVRINVDDNPTKSTGSRGGFAVGGYSTGKGLLTNEYLRVTPDSVRVYFNDTPIKGTGSRGGFAVGGFSTGKTGANNYMYLEPDNYFIGQESGKSITTGLYNSFLGYQTGYSATEANNNVLLGYKAGFSNTIGNSNVFIGNTSGYMNDTGSYNVFLGNSAGLSNNSDFNVFIGDSTGLSNTLGTSNVFVGYQAGKNNTTGVKNTYIGYLAGYSGTNASGFNNIFMGVEAGYSSTTSSNNIAIGNGAGRSILDGIHNVMIGTNAGNLDVTGDFNTMIGYRAGEQTIADWNTFLGNNAGRSNTTGGSQVMLGFNAGSNNTGAYNTFVGSLAGGNSGAGWFNTYLGLVAGNQAPGSYNVFLGKWAGYHEAGSYKLIIESNYSLTNNYDSALVFGDFLTRKLRFNGDVNIRNSLSVAGDISVSGSVTANNFIAIMNGTGAYKYNVASDMVVPDYVFDKHFEGKSTFNPEYEMLSLTDLSDYINKNRHLPGVPSRAEIAKDGAINIQGLSMVTLEKVEENTLYILELENASKKQQKIIDNQQNVIEELKLKNTQLEAKTNEIDALKTELESIKTLLNKK